jgi:NADPH:quinone reductase-like Zn-dependent oxidoreductase
MTTTKAQRIHQFGGPEVITWEETEIAAPEPGQVLIKVHAAGVGPWDAWIRSGQSALPQPLPLTLGSDVAGTVMATPPGDRSLEVGLPVFGVTNARFTGAYALHALVDADRIVPKPDNITFFEAGSLSVVAVTARKMLFEHGNLQRGQRVLIHGAAGNVGRYAVRMAHDVGATVIAYGYVSDSMFLRALGADEVCEYGAGPCTEQTAPVDLVLDTVGASVHDEAFAALKRGGALISIVQPPDEAKATEHGVRAAFFVVNVRSNDLSVIARQLESGIIAPSVGLVLPITDAQRAHELLAKPDRSIRGKMVLDPSQVVEKQ